MLGDMGAKDRIRADSSLATKASAPDERDPCPHPEQHPWPQYMKVPTAARYLDVSVSMVYKLMAAGVDPLPSVKVGADTRIRRADLDAHVARRMATVRAKGNAMDAVLAELRATPR